MNASKLYQGPCPELSCYLISLPVFGDTAPLWSDAPVQPSRDWEPRTGQEAMAVKENQCDEGAARGKDRGLVPEWSICQHCCQLFLPDNHLVRLLPKRRPAAREHSVLRREARGKHLSLAQRELLRRYRSASSILGKMASGDIERQQGYEEREGVEKNMEQLGSDCIVEQRFEAW
ncbi:unnamed protein product [Lota lota]